MENNFSWIRQPVILVNEIVCRNNIGRMVEKAATMGAALRPHFKTHQSGQIAEWFRESGVKKITVSSVAMAAYFADYGWDDITIAFPVNLRELDTINKLSEKARLQILIESAAVAQQLNESLSHPQEAMIKVDSGAHRTGIPLDKPDEILALAEKLADMSKLRFRGLLTHAGHTYRAKGLHDIADIVASAREKMVKIKDKIGIDSLILSWGDTPSCSMLEDLHGFDEWRPGNFVFYDIMQYHIGACKLEDIAVQLVCPVVAVHDDRDELVLYGGAVHFSKDFIAADNGFKLYGYVQRNDNGVFSAPLAGAWLSELSQEHGIVKLPKGGAKDFKPGDLVAVLPIHSCLSVSSMRSMYGFNGEHYSCMSQI